MRSSRSLRTRLAWSIALLVVLLSWIFGAFVNADFSSRLRDSASLELAELAYQMGDRLDRDMAGRSDILHVFSALEVLQSPSDVAQQRALLDQLQRHMSGLAWIGLLDVEGNVQVASGRILEGVNIAQRPVYVEGRQGLFIGDVHEAVLLASLLPNPTGEPMKFVDISLPLKDEQGDFVGVLATHLSWSWAEEISRSLLNPDRDRRQIDFFVLSANGTVLLGPEGWVGLPLPHMVANGKNGNRMHYGVMKWEGVDEGRYLTGIAPADGHGGYPGLGWTVVARQPLHVADAPARALQRDIYIVGTVLALLFAVAGWFLSSRLTRPLQQIARAADRLAAGRAAEIPVIPGIKEVKALGESIRHLVDTLGHQENRLGEMSELALTDRLTGLANRAGFESYLRRHDVDSPMALLFLDLDGFKQVNDQLGHAAGDELLRLVAERLRSKVREGDLLVRLGGDEFVMVLNIRADELQDTARQIAERTLNALGMPMLIAGTEARVGCSIGGAFWPADGQTPEEVLGQADRALYLAKAQGKHRAVFTSD